MTTRVDGHQIAPEDHQMVEQARPGDRVTIVTPHGQERSGRVVMKFATHLTLNLGGKHGTPGVANARNIVRLSPSRKQHGGA